MATVPTYDGPQVQSRGLSFDQATADSFGNIQAKEIGKTGEAINSRFGLSSTLDNINDRDVTRQVFEAEAKTKEAYVQWSADAMTNYQGAGAQGIAQKAKDWWAKQEEDTRSNMANPQAQRMFGQAMRTQSIASLDHFSKFEGQQLEVDLSQKTDANVLSSAKLAAAIPTPENITLQTNNIKAALGQYGKTRWSPEVLAEKTAGAVSEMSMGVFNNLFAMPNGPLMAKAFYEKAVLSGSIDPRKYDEIETKLKAGVADQIGGGSAREDIATLMAGKKATDPFPQSAADALGVIRFADNPDALKSFRAELDRQAALHAGEVSKVEASSLKAVDAMRVKNMSLADMKRTPEWSAMSPTTQVAMSEHITDLNFKHSQRSRTLSIQGEEDVIRAEQRQERKMAPTMLEYAQPQNLVRLTPDKITQLMPTIGAANVDKLLTRYTSFTKNQAALTNANLDNDAFNNAYASTGKDPKPNHKNADEVARVVRARDEVETSIGVLQQSKGRELTREEKNAEIKRVITGKVFEPGYWGSEKYELDIPDSQRLTSTVGVQVPGKPGQMTTIQIPVGSIPANEFAQTQERLRSTGQPYDTASVVRRWHKANN